MRTLMILYVVIGFAIVFTSSTALYNEEYTAVLGIFIGIFVMQDGIELIRKRW